MKDWPTPDAKLCARFRRMFGSDSARISRHGKQAFLIIGTMKVAHGWSASREGSKPSPFKFSYLEETCVSRGETEKQLLSTAAEYKSLLGKTMADELNELFEKQGIVLPPLKT